MLRSAIAFPTPSPSASSYTARQRRLSMAPTWLSLRRSSGRTTRTSPDDRAHCQPPAARGSRLAATLIHGLCQRQLRQLLLRNGSLSQQRPGAIGLVGWHEDREVRAQTGNERIRFYI